MAKSKNNLSNLTKHLSSGKLPGLSTGKLLSPTDLINSTQAGGIKSTKIGNAGDTKALSMNAKDTATSITFGRPSSTRTSASQSGSVLTSLLKQSSSGGIASALSGGLGGLGGIGSLVSGILGLFSGGASKSTLPPLIEFQLPRSQDETVYLSAKGNTVFQGSAAEPASTTTPAGPQYQSAHIVQAVKSALLNSSSL